MTTSKRDNVCLGAAGLVIGSTTSQFATTRAVPVVINGRAYNVAIDATQPFTLPSSIVNLAIRQTCAFFILADSSGVLTSQQSSVVTASDSPTGYVAGAWDWPDVADKAVIGAIVIKSGAAVFTPGTTALTSVATYIDAALDYGKPITY